MSNRFEIAAMFIDAGGPVNPSGVAHTLVEAMSEARIECWMATPVRDPACRIIFRELAALMGHYLPRNEADETVCRRIADLKLTPAQFATLRSKWRDMGVDKPNLFSTFLLTAQREICGPAVMVPWCGIMLGIEPNGHAHS